MPDRRIGACVRSTPSRVTRPKPKRPATATGRSSSSRSSTVGESGPFGSPTRKTVWLTVSGASGRRLPIQSGWAQVRVSTRRASAAVTGSMSASGEPNHVLFTAGIITTRCPPR